MATQVTVITGEGSTTYSVSTGARGPAGPASNATPAGDAGSVQFSNGTALAADSGLVFTGTGDLGKLKVGGGRIYMDATTGAIQANNIAIGGSNGVMPFANVTPAAGNVGSLNVSIGSGNFAAITTGARNVACGSYSMIALTMGSNNLGIGDNTLSNLTTGSRNIALGSGSGGPSTGNDNILIGSATDVYTTSNCQIAIAAAPDGPSSTVIGFSGRGNEVPTTQTRFIGNTIIWGDGVVGQNSPNASANNRTSLVQSATNNSSAKTITLPNVTGKLPVYTDTPVAGRILTATDDSGAATWQVAAGGAPTNATVNTAINTNPAATRYALSAERKQNFGASIQNLRGQTSKNLRVVTFGDSLVALGTPLNLSGVIPIAGGSCTAGASAAISSMTITANSTTDTFTSASHGLLAGDIVSVSSSNTLPVNLSVDTPYFVITVATNTFQLSATLGGSAINIDSNGSGTITLFRTAISQDWTYPGGRYVNISNGQTRRWGEYNVTAAAYPFNHASIFKIYYIRGVGTLRLRSATGVSTSFADITGHTAISTDTGTAGTIGVYTVTLPGNGSNFYRIETVCDVGTVKILFVHALADVTGTRDSYHLSCLGLGGSYDSDWYTCQQPNWTAVLTSINPHLIVFKAADFHIADKTTAGNWATVLTRIRTAAPNAVMLLIDSHPWSGNTDPTTDPSGWSAGLKAYAAANAPMVQFVECRKFFPNYADMVTFGFIGAEDGIHLSDPVGRSFESALVLDHLSTLTVAPYINEILASKIFSRLAGVIGTVKSAYLSGPEWAATGDLTNANGYIGMFNQIGTGAQVGQGPHLIGFATAATNFRVVSALALGLTKTSHQLLVQSRVNNRIIIGNLGDAENATTGLLRDSNAQLEVFGNSASTVTLAASCISGQTANIFEVKTSATLSASGTIATAFGPAGALITVPVAHTATTAAVDVNTPTTALTTTAPSQAITLANGVAGQIKIITHVATSGSGTAILTPATKTGYTTVTFTAVGDTVTMQYYTTIGWIVLSHRGASVA